MNARVEREDRVVELLGESARWHLAGRLLRRPGPGWRERILLLAREMKEPALAGAVAKIDGASEGAYLALFGPGGPVSPREVSYRPSEDPGRLLAELGAFHEAFGYRADAEEPRDHVAVAADFVGYLALKQAYAIASGGAEEAETTRRARERFTLRHVGVCARGMQRRLERIDWPDDHLTGAVRALRTLAGTDGADEAGVGDAPEDEPFLRPGLDGAVFDCGALGEDGTCDGLMPCGRAPSSVDRR